MTDEEKYCETCDHIEMCKWTPIRGCAFHSKYEKRPHGEWIDVNDRQPEEMRNVLVWYEYYSFRKERLVQQYGISYVFKGSWMGDVSGVQARCLAWMPLPKPYKGE